MDSGRLRGNREVVGCLGGYRGIEGKYGRNIRIVLRLVSIREGIIGGAV